MPPTRKRDINSANASIRPETTWIPVWKPMKKLKMSLNLNITTMKTSIFLLLWLPFMGLGQDVNQETQNELKALNERLFKEYTLNKNTKPLEECATEGFVLIAGNGMLETKDQAINGVDNVNVSEIKVQVDKVILSGNTGIVIGVLDMKGTIMGRPVPGKIRFSSTFLKFEDRWRLVTRTMTMMRRLE
ncbi:nuclear transport factor 2 family protein [Maribacter flavus]|uniref:Nuclear transport factor 2 family protein n=1 Tax=Maribacter flavus TaxID=1658664 RepID=A0A5B2TWT0_9FLAO|nr:nuclear transport factor 2 family protein [Maribacter flavus]